MSLFRKQAVRQYMDPDARGGLLRVAPPSGIRMFAVLGLLFAVALWIALFQTVSVTAQGRGVVRPAEGVYLLRAPVSGRVAKLHSKPGSLVMADALLFTVELAVEGDADADAEGPLADLLAKRRAEIAILEAAGDEAGANLLRRATAQLEREAERLREEGSRSTTKRQIEVRAPAAGRLDALAVQLGVSVVAGKPVAKIIPEGGRFVGIMALAGRHRAQVDAGRTVRLKLDEHPSDEAGFGSATIARISADPLSGDMPSGPTADPLLSAASTADAKTSYLVELKLEAMPPRAQGSFHNGMAFTGEVVLREQRIITLLFPPLEGMLSRSE